MAQAGIPRLDEQRPLLRVGVGMEGGGLKARCRSPHTGALSAGRTRTGRQAVREEAARAMSLWDLDWGGAPRGRLAEARTDFEAL